MKSTSPLSNKALLASTEYRDKEAVILVRNMIHNLKTCKMEKHWQLLPVFSGSVKYD